MATQNRDAKSNGSLQLLTHEASPPGVDEGSLSWPIAQQGLDYVRQEVAMKKPVVPAKSKVAVRRSPKHTAIPEPPDAPSDTQRGRTVAEVFANLPSVPSSGPPLRATSIQKKSPYRVPMCKGRKGS